MAGRSGFWIQGTLLHTPRRGELEVIEDGLVEVDAGGRIAALSRPRDPDYRGRRAAAMRSGGCRSLSATEFLLPGLVDLHVHAPQWPQAGKALDLPLERWLREHTFPLEARYADTAFARSVYDSLVATLLGNGTTTAVYYATLHVEATKALADACLERG
jgi:guanine deaminase